MNAYNSADWTGHGTPKKMIEPPRPDPVGHSLPFTIGALVLPFAIIALCAIFQPPL